MSLTAGIPSLQVCDQYFIRGGTPVQHTIFNAPVTADTKPTIKTTTSHSVSIQHHRLLEYKTLNTRRMKTDNKHYFTVT
jgi:hypothetical protein